MSTTSPRLRVSGLTKDFFGVKVLHGVSFEVQAGKVLGLIGENGSGKSTAMNLLTGVFPWDEGEVWLDGAPFKPASRRESDAAGIAFIQQELNIFPNLTVAENLFLARPLRRHRAWPFIARRQMQARTRELLAQVDLNVRPDVLAATLTAGERQLLEIARGLATEARLFILDEPTTSLTSREAVRLFDLIGKLKRRGVAVIYISHNLEDVLGLSDDIVVMRDGKVTLTAAAEKLTAEQLVTAMVGRAIDALFPKRGTPAKEKMLALEVSGLTQPGVFNDIHLDVRAGEIVGLAGLMGSGRSEVARAVFGLDPHSAGHVRIGGQEFPPQDLHSRIEAGMAFLTEDRRVEGLLADASVADNFALASLPLFSTHALGALRRVDQRDAICTLARELNLRSGDLERAPIRTLSGGNQQKVMLGRWLLRKPKVFILDEPTRGVDIGAKQDIYRLLAAMAEQGVALLVISSELEELLGLCDRILVMREGRLAGGFPRADFDREAILRTAFGQAEGAA